MKIRELPYEERPREKIVTEGEGTLSNAELLAIFIRTGTREKTAIEIANEILAIDKSGILFLESSSIEELEKVKGIGQAKASTIKAAVEIGKRIATTPKIQKDQIKEACDVANLFMEQMRYYKKEHFLVLLLDSKGGIISKETISIGDISSSLVHPRETFLTAIKRNAAGVILLHNHPSGDPSPSKEDICVTKRIKEAGEIIGIEVLDHIIIGNGEYISLREKGKL